MARFFMAIINNDRSLCYIVLFFIAVSILFSGLYCVVLPFLEGVPAIGHSMPDAGRNVPITYLDCYYFSATTQTTVGYGDIVAVSKLGKVCSLVQCVFGYFYLAFSAAVFACRGIMRSRKFEVLLQAYRRDVKGLNEYIANN